MFSKESVELSTFLFNDRDVAEMMETTHSYGVQDIEFFGMDYCHWAPGDSASSVISLSKKYSIDCKSMHLTVEPLLDPDPLKARKAMNTMLECLRFAFEIGAKKAVMHAGLSSGMISEKNKEQLAKALRTIALRAQEYGMLLLIENLPAFGEKIYGGSMGDLLELYDQANVSNIRFCYDTGHARVNGANIFTDFAVSRDLISMIHISDNFGMRGTDFTLNDAHLPPLEGDLPWKELMKLFFEYPAELSLVLETSPRATVNDTPEEILVRSYRNLNSLMEPYL